MRSSVEADEFEEPEFKWGKKRGIGGRKKDVQFYESFTYDGVDYALYDCVYMYKQGEPAPYIGKLVKAWESGDKSKKIKVHWFFRPSEISYYLRDAGVLENELFFASGVGDGLANLNPLEAIAGKCNVVCISTDSRNPQPSAEELQMADYVFYRLFDVKTCTISDQMDDLVGGLEVKFVFNRVSVRTLEGTALGLDDKDERNTMVRKVALTLAGDNSPQQLNNVKMDTNGDGMLEREDKNVKQVQVKQESSPGFGEIREITGTTEENRSSLGAENVGFKVSGGGKDKLEERMKSGRKSGCTDDTPSKRAKSEGTVSSLKAKDINGLHSLIAPEKDAAHADPESELVKNSVRLGKDMKLAGSSSDLGKMLSKTSFSLTKSRSGHCEDAAGLAKDTKLTKDLNTLQGDLSSMTAFPLPPTEKSESAHLKDSVGSEDRKLGGNLSACKERQSTSNAVSRNETAGPSINNFSTSATPKSASNKDFGRSQQAAKLVKSSSTSIKRQLKTSANMSKEKLSPRYSASYEKKDTTLAKDSCSTEEGVSKKAKFDDSVKISEYNKNNIGKKLKDKTCVGETESSLARVTSYDDKAISRLGKGPLKESHNEKMGKHPNDYLRNSSTREDGGKVKGQIFEVTRRPIVENKKWIKLTWKERMKDAHNQGRLVLLQNLDPEYTSGEVEDIIWSAFGEISTAKMVPHTAITNPHSGQAFVIFKTREAVDRVVRKLDDGCLILPNQRPLVACTGVFPQLLEKQTAFVGHLSIDKNRRQIQREMKDAVSTSHYSQNNTIEYEMAMSWCLLQSKSDKWWEKLYEQQHKEIKRLTHDLKAK